MHACVVCSRTKRQPPGTNKQIRVLVYILSVLPKRPRRLEKNRGKLHPDTAKMLTTSESPLLQMIAPPAEESSSKAPTVSGTFRASLRQLSATMIATHQHFIRCIQEST